MEMFALARTRIKTTQTLLERQPERERESGREEARGVDTANDFMCARKRARGACLHRKLACGGSYDDDTAAAADDY